MSRFTTDLEIPKNKKIDTLICYNYCKYANNTVDPFHEYFNPCIPYKQDYEIEIRGIIADKNKKNKDDDDINIQRIRMSNIRNVNNNTVRQTTINGLRKTVEYMFTDNEHETEWWNK